MSGSIEHDDVSGRKTTGHVWDGIKELNTPLPSWWLYILYATIVWGIGYWIVYPAWPMVTDYTRGLLGYSSRADVTGRLQQAAAARAAQTEQLTKLSVEQISADPRLLGYSIAGGRSVFAVNCAPCHGAGGQGGHGYPVLADDDWLWGGDLANIERTIRYGIRGTSAETRQSEMPKFGVDQLLTADQIADVAAYALSLSAETVDKDAAARGQPIFAEQCAACHGEDGGGNMELGAPSLKDRISLYGNTPAAVAAQVANPHHAVMPTWEGRLDDATIKMLAVYVHSLGGGQ
jgi:cytochrome c oxidase cbb3-type subunit III